MSPNYDIISTSIIIFYLLALIKKYIPGFIAYSVSLISCFYPIPKSYVLLQSEDRGFSKGGP